jgi:cytochrome P450
VIDTLQSAHTVPAHVPADLVWNYDFATDPLFETDPLAAQLALTDGAPDIFFSPLRGGFWVLTRFADIRDASRQPEIFSNYPVMIPAAVGRSRKMAPIEIDPPELDRYRFTLGPALAPPRAKAMEAEVRGIARGLLDQFAHLGRADFVEQFSSKLPVRLFLKLVDVAEGEADKLHGLHHDMVWAAKVEARAAAGMALEQYYTGLVAERQKAPGTDLISRYLQAQPEGGPFSFEDVVDATFQLFVAGLDTVTNSLSLSWRYLAENPSAQRAIREDPAIIPDAVDELMRYTSLISSTRTLTRDHVFGGVAMRKGDRVLMPLRLANRDPDVFEGADEVRFDRKSNTHLAFGSGPHRCLGSHLARVEMVVAMEEWFARVPRFALDPDDPPVGHGGHAMGLSRLPLVWTA